MAIYSPLRSRRLAAQQVEATQRLITFKLGEEMFALPLNGVHKVTKLDAPGERLGQRLYGDPGGTGVSLTTYQGRELVVIDVGHRIFGKAPQVLPPSPKKGIGVVDPTRSSDLVRYLLILQSAPTDAAAEQRLVGLPLDSPPTIQSIQVSAFQPLPEIYRQSSNIHCVSSVSIDLPDRPSIFLLDVAAIVGS
jgi:chemotaxis signal transduction protein